MNYYCTDMFSTFFHQKMFKYIIIHSSTLKPKMYALRGSGFWSCDTGELKRGRLFPAWNLSFRFQLFNSVSYNRQHIYKYLKDEQTLIKLLSDIKWNL